MLKNFKFTKFRFVLKAEQDILLPAYKGAVLRGGFGYTFKNIVCVQRFSSSCSECMISKTCIYAYIFETPLPEDAKKLRSYKVIPHPFVIEPYFNNERIINKGSETEFNLILIGKAIDYLPYFIFTFVELGKKGICRTRSKYTLKDVQSLDLTGQAISVYNSESKTLANNYTVLTGDMFDSIDQEPVNDKINLEFLTHCRIKFNEKITCKIDFHVLIRNLLRRLSTISLFHCDQELEYDYKELIKKAENIETINNALHWHDWERFSTRQKQNMSLGGAIGNITFQGDFTPFLPIIKLGEYIHVGKGTSFGLGRYIIKQE